MKIGSYKINNKLILAPMAGVSDLPFRRLCRQLGAGMTVSEMVSSDPTLRKSRQSQNRIDHSGEAEPRSVQIFGADPKRMAEAARYNVEHGAQIIDINMGCPAKKVCKKAAGSALLKDQKLVESILTAVVRSVNVPVTLKMRTGWDKSNRNAVKIAKIAEDSGVKALTIHGRTRACGYAGEAEYRTIRAVKDTTKIPVIANGDIDTPKKAKQVLQFTNADAIMIGRAAQGRPWIFRDIDYFLDHGQIPGLPDWTEIRSIVVTHVQHLYAFYGPLMGVRIARKHVGWYFKSFPTECHRNLKIINQAVSPDEQLDCVDFVFDQLKGRFAA